MVDGVIEAPGGAHFTECPPDYGRDEAFQREYAASAKDEEGWQSFRAEWLDVPEAEYQRKVRARGAAGERHARRDLRRRPSPTASAATARSW